MHLTVKITNIFLKTYNKLFNQPLIHSLLLLLLSIFMVTINNETKIQNYIGYGLLIIGMITVGIPHGAVDYLEKKGEQNFNKLFKYIIKEHI